MVGTGRLYAYFIDEFSIATLWSIYLYYLFVHGNWDLKKKWANLDKIGYRYLGRVVVWFYIIRIRISRFLLTFYLFLLCITT